MVHAKTAIICCGESAILSSVVRFAEARGSTYEVVSLPGGSWWIAQLVNLTKGVVRKLLLGNVRPVKEMIRSMIDQGTEEVVLVAHQDCNWYRRINPAVTSKELVRLQGQDLFLAKTEIAEWSGRALSLEAFIATRESGEWRFNKLY